jgi:hypothetical protein
MEYSKAHLKTSATLKKRKLTTIWNDFKNDIIMNNMWNKQFFCDYELIDYLSIPM